MDFIIKLFGVGDDLNPLQMSLRAVVAFVIGLILVRFSGRRAFGMRMSFDNVMTILLGAILSRAVVGASPFIPTICAAITLVVLHRLFAWITLKNSKFGKVIKGEVKILFEKGKFNHKNMSYCLITENDLAEALRSNGGRDTFDDIKIICAERNGYISIVKKDDENGNQRENRR